jgi:alpha-L-glutamate ligase-like protein
VSWLDRLRNVTTPRQLRARGIMGINRRNAELILPNNPRRLYPNVDDKLRTKKLCEANGIPVPRTYAVITRQGDVRRFAEVVADIPELVIKPAHGAGGRGIVVVTEHDGRTFTRPSGETMSMAEVRHHLSSVISGLFSLGGQPDVAIVEQRIRCHPDFAAIAVEGTPDVRVIVYLGTPVMAMLRLPTRASRGRANLHQGAVGAGVDLDSGRTLGGVLYGQAVDRHPDTGELIGGVQVPFWERILTAAAEIAPATGLGYVGVDFVADEDLGPVILEVNARPGLAIQVANRQGLVARIREIEATRRRG